MITITSSDKACICKTARAVGSPKKLAHRLTNQFTDWIRENGLEWAISREKEMKLWYLNRLSNDHHIPDWVAHDKNGLPVNAYREVFKMKNTARALALLSLGSMFKWKPGQFSQAQTNKFLGSILALDKPVSREDLRSDKFFETYGGRWKFTEDLSGQFKPWPIPMVDSINYWNGKGRPTLGGPKVDRVVKTIQSIFDPDKLGPVVPEYYRGSLPEKDDKNHGRRVTSIRDARKFLDQDLRQNFPMSVAVFLHNLNRDDLVPELHWSGGVPGYGELVGLANSHGRMVLIQEPYLKPRAVGNPNRILQFYLEPLAKFFNHLGSCEGNSLMDQDAGKRWAQGKLQEGVELACSDLTSASDLFDFRKVEEWIREEYHLDDLMDSETWENYRTHMALFKDSTMNWVFNSQILDKHAPNKERLISWKKGWCLGTRASFGYLSLANIICARRACRDAGLPYSDTFRIVGDDIVMDSRIEPFYKKYILELGGSINETKTMRSSEVAEFAGSIITPNYIMPKNLKFKSFTTDHSDEAINVLRTSYASVYDIFRLTDLVGDQALGLLNKRQRKLYHQYKMIPGVAVSGPWSQNSHGEPLSKRVHYAETVLEPNKPDKDIQETTQEMSLLKASIQESPLLRENPELESQADEPGDPHISTVSTVEDFSSMGPSFDLPRFPGKKDHYQTPILGTPPSESLIQEHEHGDPRAKALSPDNFLQRKSSLSKGDKLPAKGSGKPTFSDDFDPLGIGTNNRYQRPVHERISYEDLPKLADPQDISRTRSIRNRLIMSLEFGSANRTSALRVLHSEVGGLSSSRVQGILNELGISLQDTSWKEYLDTISVGDIVSFCEPLIEVEDDIFTKDLT